METEELMMFLNDIAKNDSFRNNDIINELRKGLKKFKLREELMNWLKEEEMIICTISEKRINTFLSSEVELKYFIESEGKYTIVHLKN